MLIDLRFYTFHPGKLAEFMKLSETEILPLRTRYCGKRHPAYRILTCKRRHYSNREGFALPLCVAVKYGAQRKLAIGATHHLRRRYALSVRSDFQSCNDASRFMSGR